MTVAKKKKPTKKADKFNKIQEQYFYDEIKEVTLENVKVYKNLKNLPLDVKAKEMIDSMIFDLKIIKKRYSKKSK